MALRVDVVTLPVRHLPWAVQFYGLGLGLTLAASEHGRVARFSTEGVALILEASATPARDGAGHPSRATTGSIRLTRIAPDRAEVDRILIEAIGAGGTLLRPPLSEDVDGYSGWFADLDGHTWEVTCAPRKHGR
jgi:predicted lactoylglutathione lyase